MSNIATKTRKLYRAGALKLSAIKAMLRAGKITQEEYDWIISDDGESTEE